MTNLDPNDLEPNEEDHFASLIEWSAIAASLAGLGIFADPVKKLLLRHLDLQQDRAIRFLKEFFELYKANSTTILQRLEDLEKWQHNLLRAGIFASSEIPNEDNISELARLVFEGVTGQSHEEELYTYCIRLLSGLSRGEINLIIHKVLEYAELANQDNTSRRIALRNASDKYNINNATNYLYPGFIHKLISNGLLIPDLHYSPNHDKVPDMLEKISFLYQGRAYTYPTPLGFFFACVICEEIKIYAPTFRDERIKILLKEYDSMR